MLALRDPPEKHLVVCDGQEDWAPDKQKSPVRSPIVPGFCQLPRLGCEGGSAPGLAHGPRAVENGALLGHGDADNPSPAPREGWYNTAGCAKESNGGPTGPYGPPGRWDTVVGDAAAEEAEKEEQQEYSRVSGVWDHTVVLGRDHTPLTPKDPKQMAARGLLDSGYVDSVPSLP